MSPREEEIINDLQETSVVSQPRTQPPLSVTRGPSAALPGHSGLFQTAITSFAQPLPVPANSRSSSNENGDPPHTSLAQHLGLSQRAEAPPPLTEIIHADLTDVPNVDVFTGVPLHVPLGAVDADLIELLEGGADANPLFPSFLGTPSSRSFELSSLSSLRRGFVVPFLRYAEDPPSFSSLTGINGFYAVSTVQADGSADLVLLVDRRPLHLHREHPLPSWVVFNSPLEVRRIPTMSGQIIDMGQLPVDVRSALSARRIVPCAPSSTRLPSVSDPPPLSSDITRGAQLREIASAPLRRALHGDSALFNSLVGPSGDVTSKTFMNNLRNMQTSSVLSRLPFFHPDHLECFLAFRWGRELCFSGKKAEVCHLALFRAFNSKGEIQPFHSPFDLCLALENLQTACVTLFGESAHRPFFATLFLPLQQLLRSRDLLTSLSAVPIDFLVWRLSGVLVQWSALFNTDSFANMPFDAFFAHNVSALHLDQTAVRLEVITLDPRLLPRQYGSLHSTARSPTPSVPVTGGSPAGARKRPATRDVTSPAKASKPSTASPIPVASSPVVASKGKYLCVADQCNAYDSVTYPPCPRGSACPQRHEPKPSDGRMLPASRAELITSVASMKHLAGAKKAQLTAFFNSLP